MKKFLSLIVVLMLAFNVKAQSLAIATEGDSDVCTIVIEMFDSYGDGWGSDVLGYSLNGADDVVLDFTEKESSKTHTLEVSKGTNLVITYYGQNQYEENSVKISYQDGDVLYEASSEEGSPNYLHQDNWNNAVFVDTTVDCGGENEGGDNNTGNEGGNDNTGDEGSDDNTGDEGGDNTGDEGDDDNEEPVKPEIPNVVATTTETTVTLTWNAIEGATSYHIYTPEDFASNVYYWEDTTYTFDSLTPGTEYCFKVSAVYPTNESNAVEVCATTKASEEDEGGNDNTGDEGDDDNTGDEGSDDNTGDEGSDDNTGDEGGDNTGDEGDDDNEEPVKPEIPNVVATATDTTITLTWEAIKGATSYNIYTPSSFSYNVLGWEDTTYTFDSLTPGKKYCFNVSAVYPTDESDAVEVCATTENPGEDEGGDEGGDDNEEPENPDGNIEVAENNFTIYPNPVEDRLCIETQTQTLTVEIYDVYGRRQELSAVSHQPSAIDVSSLNSGIYFVKVITSEGEIVKRFVKK